jgi:nitrogen regulatory protein PII
MPDVSPPTDGCYFPSGNSRRYSSSIEGRDPVLTVRADSINSTGAIITIMAFGIIIRIKTYKRRSRKKWRIYHFYLHLSERMGRRFWKNPGKAGAEGGTILFGRGLEYMKSRLSLVSNRTEKEIVLTVTSSDKQDEIMNEIVKAGELGKPGAGIAFVVPVEKMVGVCHRIDNTCIM